MWITIWPLEKKNDDMIFMLERQYEQQTNPAD